MSRSRIRASAAFLFAAAAAAAPVSAQSFRMTVQGILDSRSTITGVGATPLGSATPFTLTALFNTSTPNLVAPIGVSGFVSYTPSLLELSISGRTYAIQPYTLANPTGLAVAIFDRSTPFNPGLYGVGVIQNPLADGAGIVADYSNALPQFTLGATGVVPTVFTGFNGVGVSSGVCLVGTPGSCVTNAITPIPMQFGPNAYALTLGNYSQNTDPNFIFSVSITAVPEPQSLVLVGMGVLVLGAAARRRQRARG